MITEAKIHELDMPAGLDAAGQRAHAIIVAYLKEHGLTDTGGSKAFYSPVEWRELNREYGTRSHLVIAYERGAMSPVFSMDAAYELDCAPVRPLRGHAGEAQRGGALLRRVHQVVRSGVQHGDRVMADRAMITFTVKRFVVFAGDQYYPDGGWSDFKSSHDTLNEALNTTRGDWWHVVDLVTGKIVESGGAR